MTDRLHYRGNDSLEYSVVNREDFDANTILKADSDNTPEALTIAVQRIIGRITAGEIDALTGAQVLSILTGQAAAAFGWNSQALTGVGEITLVPKELSSGAEGTIFYDSDDDHIYVATE
jgi:hypothetical protein